MRLKERNYQSRRKRWKIHLVTPCHPATCHHPSMVYITTLFFSKEFLVKIFLHQFHQRFHLIEGWNTKTSDSHTSIVLISQKKREKKTSLVQFWLLKLVRFTPAGVSYFRPEAGNHCMLKIKSRHRRNVTCHQFVDYHDFHHRITFISWKISPQDDFHHKITIIMTEFLHYHHWHLHLDLNIFIFIIFGILYLHLHHLHHRHHQLTSHIFI